MRHRWLIIYLVASATILVLGTHFSWHERRWEGSALLWMLGPLANLVWGLRFLPAYVVGSIAAIWAIESLLARPNRPALWGIAIAVWITFGLVAYSPAI